MSSSPAAPCEMTPDAEAMAGAPEWLSPGGAVVLELADGTAGRVRDLARSAGLRDVAVHPDLGGTDRVLVARRPV